MRLPEPGAPVDEEGVVRRAGGLRHRARRRDREAVGGAHDVGVEPEAGIELVGHPPTGVLCASRFRTCSEIPLRVSKTPLPCRASPPKLFTPRKLRASSSSAGLRISSGGRSCLLYWKTVGKERTSIPCSSMLTCRFCRLSRLSSSRRAWLSATKTTPSAPCSTSFRVAL